MIDIKAVMKGIGVLIDDQYKALSADKPDEACAASHRGQIAAYQHVLYILSALEEGEERERRQSEPRITGRLGFQESV